MANMDIYFFVLAGKNKCGGGAPQDIKTCYRAPH